MPLSSAIFAIVGAFLFSSSQPVLILRVTGTSTAFTTAFKISSTNSSFCMRADPAALLHTFFAGHPILISIISAPNSNALIAEFASSCASDPAI